MGSLHDRFFSDTSYRVTSITAATSGSPPARQVGDCRPNVAVGRCCSERAAAAEFAGATDVASSRAMHGARAGRACGEFESNAHENGFLTRAGRVNGDRPSSDEPVALLLPPVYDTHGFTMAMHA